MKQTSKRLEILEASLEKKQARFDNKFNIHMADVRQANGQPLNDKRNGWATLKRWDRQNDALNNMNREIEKTEAAIEREQSKINYCARTLKEMPQALRALVEQGTLIQWRKHPSIFFVKGVDKARIQWKDGQLIHKFTQSITDREQFNVFKETYNSLYRKLTREV